MGRPHTFALWPCGLTWAPGNGIGACVSYAHHRRRHPHTGRFVRSASPPLTSIVRRGLQCHRALDPEHDASSLPVMSPSLFMPVSPFWAPRFPSPKCFLTCADVCLAWLGPYEINDPSSHVWACLCIWLDEYIDHQHSCINVLYGGCFACFNRFRPFTSVTTLLYHYCYTLMILIIFFLRDPFFFSFFGIASFRETCHYP